MKNFMMDFLHRIIYSCKEASALFSFSLDNKLSFTQKVRLSMHHSMCKFCNRHQNQLQTLHDLLAKKVKDQEEDLSITLSEEKKEDIKKRIQKDA